MCKPTQCIRKLSVILIMRNMQAPDTRAKAKSKKNKQLIVTNNMDISALFIHMCTT